MAFFIEQNSHVIVFGNEKGGTGKSTTAVHLIVGLLERGARVAVVDLDPRQRTLTRYLDNRREYAESSGLDLRCPQAHVVAASNLPVVRDREQEELERLNGLISALDSDHDFLVIDCPGSDTHLARRAYALAATLITPLNDSFVDLDLIGEVEPETYRVKGLSLYSETIWECRKQRALAGRRGLDWVVMRNRITHTESRNKRRVDDALKSLQGRIAFRYVPGLSERTIYRELFPKGLTLVDLAAAGAKLTMSHVAARQELRSLVDSLRLPGLHKDATAAMG